MEEKYYIRRLTAEFGRFVGTVAAIVLTVAHLGIQDAQLGGLALKLGFGTVTAVGIPWRTTDLVAEVPTVSVAVASEVRRHAVAALALERSVFALEAAAVELVRVVTAVVVVIASPLTRDAFAVGALELGLGTLSVLALAHVFRLVRIVAAIVFKVAQPSFRYASVVFALEVRGGLTLGAVGGQLVRTVATVVLAVTEQPFGNATVVGSAGASLPAGRAVSLPAHECRFVRIVTAIVVEIAHPQFRYATAVFARELRFRIALSII